MGHKKPRKERNLLKKWAEWKIASKHRRALDENGGF
jgi:hypothetical protein